MHRRRALSQLADLLCGRVPSRPDWESILALAGEQLLIPQLPARLEKVRRDVPDEVWDFLEETRRRSRARNARLYETLCEALSALNGAGVEPILLKGSALWAEPPGPLECDRLVSDLDLLVEPVEMQRAVDALVTAGFPVLEDDRLTRAHDVVVLGRPSDVGAIDLHQRAPGSPLAELDTELYSETRSVRFGDCVARVLSSELQILVIAMHDQLHDAHFWRGGFDLRRLLDIDAIAKGSVNWRRIADLCRTPTARTALAAQLQAARRIAGAAVPESMLAGGWGAFHFRRQQAQFVWPWTNRVFDFVRAFGGLRQLQHGLWTWAMRRTADGVGRRDLASGPP